MTNSDIHLRLSRDSLKNLLLVRTQSSNVLEIEITFIFAQRQ